MFKQESTRWQNTFKKHSNKFKRRRNSVCPSILLNKQDSNEFAGFTETTFYGRPRNDLRNSSFLINTN